MNGDDRRGSLPTLQAAVFGLARNPIPALATEPADREVRLLAALMGQAAQDSLRQASGRVLVSWRANWRPATTDATLIRRRHGASGGSEAFGACGRASSPWL